jgi:hypothetical protein
MMYNLTQRKRQGWTTQGAAMAARATVIKSYPSGAIGTRTTVSPARSKT